MSNAQRSHRNLTFNCGKLGLVAIQPTSADEQVMHEVAHVIFPQRIPEPDFEAAVEWAASSEATIFITPPDLKRFEAEGFGAYRFHLLEGFREIGFSEGKIKFIPSSRRRPGGFWGVALELANSWNFLKKEEFHVVLKPSDADAILYLCSASLDRAEWALLREDRPAAIVGSRLLAQNHWIALSEIIGQKIEVDSQSKISDRKELPALLQKRRGFDKHQKATLKNYDKSVKWEKNKKDSIPS